MDHKWDIRFIALAKHIAGWSKDPSTKTGAIIVRPDQTIVSVGYNGFARGMHDDYIFYIDRESKYSRIIHCEMNAILNAREHLQGYTLYVWPFMCCDRCSVHVIQVGIKRVVVPISDNERWLSVQKIAKENFNEANVEWTEIKDI